jgi:hypothetical protein
MQKMQLADFPDTCMVVRMKQENTIGEHAYLGVRCGDGISVFPDFASAEVEALVALEFGVFPGLDFIEIVSVEQLKAELELELITQYA